MRATYIRPGAYRVHIKSMQVSLIVLAAHPCEAICKAMRWME